MKKIKIHEQQLKGNFTRAKKMLALESRTYLLGRKLFVVYWESCILSFNPNLSLLARELEKYHFLKIATNLYPLDYLKLLRPSNSTYWLVISSVVFLLTYIS